MPESHTNHHSVTHTNYLWASGLAGQTAPIPVRPWPQTAGSRSEVLRFEWSEPPAAGDLDLGSDPDPDLDSGWWKAPQGRLCSQQVSNNRGSKPVHHQIYIWERQRKEEVKFVMNITVNKSLLHHTVSKIIIFTFYTANAIVSVKIISVHLYICV